MSWCGAQCMYARPVTNSQNHKPTHFKNMNFTQDPLLGIGNSYPTANQIQYENEELAKKLAQLQQQRTTINMQAQQSQTPLWDEIDKIDDSLTSGQRKLLDQNEEYMESYQYISKLVQDEILRIVRPRIESSQVGNEALRKHFALIQKLKKTITQADEQKNALWNEYIEKYSTMTWNDFIEMKKGESQQIKRGGNKK